MSKTISQAEFDRRREAGQLALTLVGMSNVGKSFWATKLARVGFEVISCDDLIEGQLGTVLLDAGFSGGITDMAKWMGQPYDPQFAVNQKIYLDLETIALKHTIERLTQPSLGGNIVVDTTGSLVHTDTKIREDLAKLSTVIYLEATEAMQAEMFRLYIAEPKPVVWGNIYTQGANQSPHEALANCYPKLLTQRSERYRQMTDITIPRQASLSLGKAPDLLAYVRTRLATKRTH